jgi:hypothetical protein
VVDAVYRLDQLVDAFRALRAGTMFGKIGIAF